VIVNEVGDIEIVFKDKAPQETINLLIDIYLSLIGASSMDSSTNFAFCKW